MLIVDTRIRDYGSNQIRRDCRKQLHNLNDSRHFSQFDICPQESTMRTKKL